MSAVEVIVAVLFIVFFFVVFFRSGTAKALFGWESAEHKGAVGEGRVARILNDFPEEYFCFHDLCFLTDTGSVQIDHLVISVYGIFIIETKNYKGWILGSEGAELWTQSIYGRRYEFRNPLRQNFSHHCALAKILNVPRFKITPLVVFVGAAVLKCRTKSAVIYSFQLSDFILSRRENQIFTQEEVQELLRKVEAENVVEVEKRHEHIDSVRQCVEKRQDLINHDVCPRCGGRLLVRNGKYGTFRGCENYPRCRFTTR